jgi:Domain of unknown function (DUF4349)
MRFFHVLLVVVVLLPWGSGCGVKSAKAPGERPLINGESPEVAGQQPAQPPAVPGADKVQSRKIIYTAAMTLITENFSKSEQELLRLVKEKDGYVVNSEVTGSPGTPRAAHWKIRVPVAQFDAFREAVTRLGELERNTTDSQDMTDEYYDLEARIKNKKVEEARLLQHLEKSTGKLDEILAVEREISRVRGEVEQMQGRLQILAKLTALTTVTITLHERGTYIPPEGPAFGTTIGRTFQGSLDALVKLGKTVVLIGVAVGPWLPLLAFIGIPLLLVWRRRRTLGVAQPVPLSSDEPSTPPGS